MCWHLHTSIIMDFLKHTLYNSCLTCHTTDPSRISSSLSEKERTFFHVCFCSTSDINWMVLSSFGFSDPWIVIKLYRTSETPDIWRSIKSQLGLYLLSLAYDPVRLHQRHWFGVFFPLQLQHLVSLGNKFYVLYSSYLWFIKSFPEIWSGKLTHGVFSQSQEYVFSWLFYIIFKKSFDEFSTF